VEPVLVAKGSDSVDLMAASDREPLYTMCGLFLDCILLQNINDTEVVDNSSVFGFIDSSDSSVESCEDGPIV